MKAQLGPYLKPCGPPPCPALCGLCDEIVVDIYAHHFLHYAQWDVEVLMSFLTGVPMDDFHSRRLVHPRGWPS